MLTAQRLFSRYARVIPGQEKTLNISTLPQEDHAMLLNRGLHSFYLLERFGSHSALKVTRALCIHFHCFTTDLK